MLLDIKKAPKEVGIPEYFIEELGENSEDFLMLGKLLKESEGHVTWEKLKKYTKIKNGKVEGIYWEEDLDLRGTSITSLGKIKKILGNLLLSGVLTLNNLGELEEIGGELDIRGTSITSLGKLKKVGQNTDLEDVSSLKDIGELEKVGGFLDISGTSIELQLEVIKKIKDGELVVDMSIYFGKDIPGINTLLEQVEIPGNLNLIGTSITNLGKIRKVGGFLDISGTSIELQLEVMRRIKNGELVVEGKVHYDEGINEIFTKEGKLNFERFEETYGIKVNEIEGEQQEQIRELLEYIKEFEKEDLQKEIIKIMKEDITQEEKKEKIAKLYIEYKVYIQKIDGYLL